MMRKDPVRRGELLHRFVFKSGSRKYLYLRIRSSDEFRAVPGQFILLDTGEDFFLDRPFSILDTMGNVFELLIEIKGPGTENLLSMNTGFKFRFKGPLGRGLEGLLDNIGEKIDLIAGGMGFVPLYFFCWESERCGRGKDISFYLGAEEKDFFTALKEHLHFPDIFREMNIQLVIFERTGETVLDRYNEHRKERGFLPDRVISCGPVGMLKEVQKMLIEMGKEGHLVLEEQMACGRGMCMGCPVKVEEDGVVSVKMVCRDGPVFAIGQGKKVVFE